MGINQGKDRYSWKQELGFLLAQQNQNLDKISKDKGGKKRSFCVLGTSLAYVTRWKIFEIPNTPTAIFQMPGKFSFTPGKYTMSSTCISTKDSQSQPNPAFMFLLYLTQWQRLVKQGNKIHIFFPLFQKVLTKAGWRL